MKDPVAAAVADAHQQDWAYVLAVIVRTTRDFELAEDVVQDAFVAALESWRRDGVPKSPAAWLITTARRKAIDRDRRQSAFERKLPLLIVPQGEEDTDMDDSPSGIPDERLRLIFTCCHPALSFEARVALTLRLVCGMSTPDIAHHFLVPETTMAARLTRAKKKILAAGIPYRVPAGADLIGRLSSVLTVIYLVYTEDHTASRGDALFHVNYTSPAISLARMLVELMPDEPDVLGLLAFLLLTDARRAARTDAAGDLVLLENQDRACWDTAAIAEGLQLTECALRLPLRGRMPGRYAIEAAIAAVHAESQSYDATDWLQLLALYDLLLAVYPAPVVALSRVAVVAQIDGPAQGLMALAAIEHDPSLSRYYLLPAARADLFRRLGRTGEAIAAYRSAIALTENIVEQRFLRRRIRELLEQ